MPCSFAARMAANSHTASSCLTPNKDLLYLIRNKIRLLIEQIQATVFSNQDLFVTDMHGQNGRRLLAQKKFKKKIPKKKATSNT